MQYSKPAPEECPLCSLLVDPKRVSGIWQYVCEGPHSTGDSMTWTWEGHIGIEPTVPSWQQPQPLTAQQKAKLQRDAVTENLLGPLRKFFTDEKRLVEHGVIEDWLRENYFAVYKEHIDELGHRMFGKPAHAQATASRQRFSTALVRLEKEGLIKHQTLPSTGAAWAHDSTISYWHRADIVPTTVITWVEHRATQQKSDDWTPADLAGLNPPPTTLATA